LGEADIAEKELKEEREEHWDKRFIYEEGNKGTNEL
jgi:hypothetical protein